MRAVGERPMRSSMRRKRFSRSTPLLLAAVLFCALYVSSSFLQVQAAALKGQIAANDNLPDLLVLGPHTKASLRRIPTAGSASSSSSHPAFGADTSSQAPQASAGNNARDKYTTYVKREGTFIFPDVAPGAYVLDIQSRWHAFPTYRVDVAPESKDEESNPAGAPDYRTLMRGGPIKVRTHVPGTPLSATLSNPPLTWPLMVHATVKHDFFVEPEGFNVKALLANPMMLIVFAGAGLLFGMPKIMANLDPDSLAEIEASQARMQQQMSAFQSGDIGSLFGGKEGSAPAAGTSSNAGNGKQGGAKRR